MNEITIARMIRSRAIEKGESAGVETISRDLGADQAEKSAGR